MQNLPALPRTAISFPKPCSAFLGSGLRPVSSQPRGGSLTSTNLNQLPTGVVMEIKTIPSTQADTEGYNPSLPCWLRGMYMERFKSCNSLAVLLASLL